MISQNIRSLRETHVLTKGEFCEMVGIDRRTLERWERGERIPDLKHVRIIVDKFYIDDLYTFMFGKRYEKRRSLTDVKPLPAKQEEPVEEAPKKEKKPFVIPKLMYIP